MSNHLAFLPAFELLRLMESRELKSRELLEAYIARIAADNPRINAVIAHCYPRARAQADASDKARARGESWGVLHGLPMTIKDTFEVEGMPCSAGDPKYRHHHPKKNSVVARRLLDAGAIIFGKTNVPYQARDFQSFNRIYGTTLNPWNLKLSPGGSSGGSAAALAAGFTSLEVGSDLSGSIRIPSHYCGVFGHKPTFGSLPLHGHIPGPPPSLPGLDLWVAGPLARSAEDLELLFQVLAESWVFDTAQGRVAKGSEGHDSVRGMRVMVWSYDPLCAIDSEISRELDHLVANLRSQGAQVTLGVPSQVSLRDICALFLNQLASVTELDAPAIYRKILYFLSPIYALIQPLIRLPRLFEHYTRGAGQSYASWWFHYERRERLKSLFLDVFNHYDVIVTPVTPNLPIPHQRFLPISMRSMMVDGKRRHYTDQMMWVSVASLFGLPATAFPLGRSDRGLPFGMQVIGAPFDDLKTIRFARNAARLTGGFQMPPLEISGKLSAD